MRDIIRDILTKDSIVVGGVTVPVPREIGFKVKKYTDGDGPSVVLSFDPPVKATKKIFFSTVNIECNGIVIAPQADGDFAITPVLKGLPDPTIEL
jgi:hypothetical protein